MSEVGLFLFLFSTSVRALTEANAKHSHVREAAADVTKRCVRRRREGEMGRRRGGIWEGERER